jgi:glycosyltransferase involved in cell wall biosynthesis
MNLPMVLEDRLHIFILGDYKSGAADGLAEFNYQNVQLLKEEFSFHFIEWDLDHDEEHTRLEIKDEAIHVHTFGCRDLKRLSLPKVFKSWIKTLPVSNTLFHLHHIFNIRNFLVSKELVQAGLPYLVTPHDSFVYGPFWNKKSSVVKKIYRKAYVQLIDKYILDHAALIHGITPQCAISLKELTDSRVEMVYNHVKEPLQQYSMPVKRKQVCFIGRFNILGKGIDLALSAFKQFKLNHNFPDSVFKMVGPANESESKARIKICKDLNLEIEQDVIFTGKVDEEERNKILKESCVYLQLSRNEGFGLSIAQALSYAKPVIISPQVPISDKIKKYGAGFVVSNAFEGAHALEKIFAMSAEDYEALGVNARKCYENEFHPSVIKPKLIKLYKTAAGIPFLEKHTVQ